MTHIPAFASGGGLGGDGGPEARGREGGRVADSRVRVLVIDDERDAVLTLVSLLREEGYDARGAYRGMEVLDLVRDFNPAAVLLDIGMPDLNGYEAARKIRERYGELRPMLIAVTGWNKSADKMLAKIAGFDHHVGKPYDPGALLALLPRR